MGQTNKGNDGTERQTSRMRERQRDRVELGKQER